MKTTNKFCYPKPLYRIGILLSAVFLYLSSCRDDGDPVPTLTNRITVETTNGRFDQFKLSSNFPANIVLGVGYASGDTIRLIKGADNQTYYFITPSNLPKGAYNYRISALRTFLTIKIDTVTKLGSQSADVVIANYLRDEVDPNINYFSSGSAKVLQRLRNIRDSTLLTFNALNASQKENVAITLLANKNFFSAYNVKLKNLRAIPVNSIGPSAVCTGENNKNYYPCLFEALGSNFKSLQEHLDLGLIFGRALNGNFYSVNSANQFMLQFLANPKEVSGFLQFINILPKALILGDLTNQANNRTWIVDADFSKIAASRVFKAGTTDTIPVKLSYRNVLDSDTLSIGSYIKNLNNFREWWNKSPVSSIVSAPALSPKTAPLALANPEVVASISFTSSTITRAATSPLLLDDGYRVRFSTSASTQQSTNITLSIAHQGFSFSKTFEAKVNP